jgi:hypothetical protein
MNFSEKLYDLLLHAYPAHYRARYAEPMRQLFRDQLRAKDTFMELAAFWIRTLADWAVSVPAQYRMRNPGPGHLKFLAPSRRCIFFARQEASSFSKPEIGLEDLLIGIARQEPSLFLDAEALVRAINAKEPLARGLPPTKHLPLSREIKRVLADAHEMAQTAGRRGVKPQDLAEGILRQQDTFAGRLLRDYIRPDS